MEAEDSVKAVFIDLLLGTQLKDSIYILMQSSVTEWNCAELQ